MEGFLAQFEGFRASRYQGVLYLRRSLPETGPHLHAGLSRYIRHYNFSRPYLSLAGRAPAEVYHQLTPLPFAGLDPDTAADTRLAA